MAAMNGDDDMSLRRVPRFADGAEAFEPRPEPGFKVPDGALFDQAFLMLSMVDRFQREIIGFPIPSEPTALDDDRAKFSAGAMREEVDEFERACWKHDLDGMADALVDLTYFALGRLIEMGIAPLPVFQEVHAANMRKRRGGVSKRPHSKGYDAVKPDGWQPPDLKPYLSVTREDILELLKSRHSPTPAALKFPDRPLIPTKPAAFCDGSTVDPRSRIMVIGHARHGKDTVCEMLRDLYGFRFTSSSMFCAERIVYPALADKYGYMDAKACFDDRGNHRAEWFNLISDYNRADPTRLGRAIFTDFDIYAGIRSAREFHALRNCGHPIVTVWVDAGERLPPEPRSSMSLEPWMADYVVDNNGSLEDLRTNLETLMAGALSWMR